MASVIDSLPEAERAKIIDALLANRSLREVAKLVGISHTAVGNYKEKVLLPALENARKLNALQDVAQTAFEKVATVDTLTKASLHSDPFVARVEKLRQEREKVKSMAIEGEKPDLRAWATLDKNDLTELELHARLCNRLTEQSGPSIAIQIVCPAGSQPEVRQAEGGVVVDITPGR